MASPSVRSIHRRDRARHLASIAGSIGLLYAILSAYWALGGTELLDTIGGTLERDARAGGLAVEVTLWSVVALKLVACALPICAMREQQAPRRRRILRRLAGLEAVILTAYGLVLTSVGLMVQARLISHSPHADQRALAWHAFLWDPWFLIWGVLVAAALRLSGEPRP